MNTPNIVNLLSLKSYDMQEHDNVNYQKKNKGYLLGVNKNGFVVQLDSALFTKWNFFKKKFGCGPLQDYQVSLRSIRKAVRFNYNDPTVRDSVAKLDQKVQSHMLKQMAIICDDHGIVERVASLFRKATEKIHSS